MQLDINSNERYIKEIVFLIFHQWNTKLFLLLKREVNNVAGNKKLIEEIKTDPIAYKLR